jgi:hypothetical protein
VTILVENFSKLTTDIFAFLSQKSIHFLLCEVIKASPKMPKSNALKILNVALIANIDVIR